MSQTRKVSGRATTIVRGPDMGIGVQYHSTVVATYVRSGVVKLDSGGWRTATTKLRMNQFSSQYCHNAFSVYQHKGEWFVHVGRDNQTLPFEDGMEVTL